MTASTLTCQELVELITDYLEDSLRPEAREQFEVHLRDCEGCQRYVEQMRATIALVGRLPAAALPAAKREHLLALFANWKSAE